MSGSRRTRPWGPLRGGTEQTDGTALLMRRWLDEVGMTVGELHTGLMAGRRCPKMGRTAVADRLAGMHLTVEFIDAVAEACFDDVGVRRARAQKARAVLTGQSPPSAAEAVRRVDGIDRRSAETLAVRTAMLDGDNNRLRLGIADLRERLQAAASTASRALQQRDEARRQRDEYAAELADLLTRLSQETEGGKAPGPTPPDRTGPGPADGGGRQPAPGAGRPKGALPTGEGGSLLQAAPVVAPSAPSRVSENAAGESATLTERDRLAFTAFREVHFRAHYSFVYARFGDHHQALRIVEETFSHLAANWAVVLRQEIPAAYAWAITQNAVRHESDHRQQRFRTVRKAFDLARTSLSVMDDASGLFEAILELPERQYEVVVLHYLLELDSHEVANYLGTSVAGVRSLTRGARRHLALKLNPPRPSDSP